MPKSAPKKAHYPRSLVPLLIIVVVLSLSIFAYYRFLKAKSTTPVQTGKTEEMVQVAAPVSLPKPSLTGRLSVEAALQARRSRRDYTSDSLNIRQVGQMLWAAQGVTTNWGGRTAPSAKSAYPVTIYLVAYKVIDLNPGVYRYLPGEREALHQIQLMKSGDFQSSLAAAIGQNAAANSPALLLVTGDMDKMAKAFDNKRMDNDVYLEVGHVAENLYLQAESLGLGMVVMGGFDQVKVRAVLNLPEKETIIYAIPFGVPKP